MQGIVTLVDIFETLIGIIPESYQNKHYKTTLQEDGSWLCDGLTPIDEIEVLLQVNIINSFEDNNFDTLAGFLLVHFKHIPMVGEQVEWDEFTFEIIEMDGIRVDKVLIQKKAD
jgi:putative hemolysin